MAKKSRKVAEKKMTREDRQISRFIEFRHQNPPRRSRDTARPFDYLGEREFRVLTMTFAAFELDINDPAQRDHVLACLAYSVFGDEREAGRPRGTKRAWDTAAKLKMIHQVNQIVKASHDETGRPPKNWKAVARKLKPHYPTVNDDHLYNRVRELAALQRAAQNKKK
jgi:hypothetical protein